MKTKITKSKRTGNKVPETPHKTDNLTIVISLPIRKSFPKKSILDDKDHQTACSVNRILSEMLFQNAGTTSRQKVDACIGASFCVLLSNLSGSSISFAFPVSLSQIKKHDLSKALSLHHSLCGSLRFVSEFLGSVSGAPSPHSRVPHKALLRKPHNDRNISDSLDKKKLNKLINKISKVDLKKHGL